MRDTIYTHRIYVKKKITISLKKNHFAWDDAPVDNVLGRNIARIRSGLGMKQSELAELLGIKQSHISEYETGKKHPSPDRIQKIARALNVTVSQLHQNRGEVGTKLELIRMILDLTDDELEIAVALFLNKVSRQTKSGHDEELETIRESP